MVDVNEEKTVVVDRDGADRSSPVGWIILLVLLLLVAMFFLFGGSRMFNSGTDGTGDMNTQTEMQTETPSVPSPAPSTETTPEPTTPAE